MAGTILIDVLILLLSLHIIIILLLSNIIIINAVAYHNTLPFMSTIYVLSHILLVNCYVTLTFK